MRWEKFKNNYIELVNNLLDARRKIIAREEQRALLPNNSLRSTSVNPLNF